MGNLNGHYSHFLAERRNEKTKKRRHGKTRTRRRLFSDNFYAFDDSDDFDDGDDFDYSEE